MEYSEKPSINEFQLRIAILTRAVVAQLVYRLATGWTTNELNQSAKERSAHIKTNRFSAILNYSLHSISKISTGCTTKCIPGKQRWPKLEIR
jgi:hypothetical protein